MAGGSARGQARRKRERAAARQSSAARLERGADGEQATADALTALPAERWTVMHDVRWPGRPVAIIDHVVIGPSGVFVIDSENWSGSIIVRDDAVRQEGRSRPQTVVGAADAALAVATLLPAASPEVVRPVLCFVRDEQLWGLVGDVMVCSTTNVAQMILSRPKVLSDTQVQAAKRELHAALGTATTSAPERRTTLPASSPSSRHRHQYARPAKGGLVSLAVVLVVLALVALNPQIVGAAAEGFADLLADTVLDNSDTQVEPIDDADQPVQDKNPKQRPVVQ